MTQKRWRSTKSLEGELRPLMHNVRLVAELDLSLAGTVYKTAREAVHPLIAMRKIGSLFTVCPTATVVFLVAEGVHRYRGGAFWPNISIDGLDSNCRNQLGRQFLKSLRRLGLETFEDVVQQERGLRYVTPILLHGGIPAYCARGLWDCLIEEMRSGQEEASLLLSRWRRYLLQGVDKPAQRFIFHGGDFAMDLLQRMIQLADDVAGLGRRKALDRGAAILAADAAVPTYLAKELLKGPSEPRRLGPRPPRPRVVLDPYGGEGPSLVLPPSAIPEGTWRIFWKGKQQTYRASSYDERQIPLVPASSWEITFLGEGAKRTTTLGPIEQAPLYVFDNSGELARNQAGFRGDTVLVLASRNLSFYKDRNRTDEVGELEELPRLAGSWSGWQPRLLDITGLMEVVICGTGPTGRSPAEIIHVRESTRRPYLVDDHFHAIRDTSSCLVFGQPPRVWVDVGTTSMKSWRVRFRTAAYSQPATLEDLKRDRSDPRIFDLAPLFASEKVVSGVIEVIGPLGSDLRAPVTIVPGLRLRMPERVIGPDEAVSVGLSADVPLGPSGLGQVELDYLPGEYTKRISVGLEQTELLVLVPRLMWALRYRNGGLPSFGTKVESIGLDEFESGDLEAILVRVGRPSSVRLELHASALLQSSPERTTGPEGRWAFPLKEYQTSAAHSDAPRLFLKLACSDITPTVAVIEATHEVSDIKAKTVFDATNGIAMGHVRWRENRAFQNRQIRLWSNHRPWENPIEVPVPNGNRGRCNFKGKTPPGPYLLEVNIADPWALPVRPPISGVGTTQVTIGADRDLHLHLTNLDEADPLEAIELELAGRGPIRSLDEEVGEVLDELQEALLARHNHAGPDSASDDIYRRLSELALFSTSHLAEIIAGLEDITESDLARLLITLLQGVIDCSPREIEESILRRLWRMSVVAGAAFDTYREGDRRCAGRWRSFTGWDPSASTRDKGSLGRGDNLPSRGGPIQTPLHTFDPGQLRDLAATQSRQGEVLGWSGHFDATLDFLIRTYEDRWRVERWQMQYETMATDTLGFEPKHMSYLQNLEKSAKLPGWCSFPRDIMACAFHLLVFGGNSQGATRALFDAVEFAPELANRSLLVAIALYPRQG